MATRTATTGRRTNPPRPAPQSRTSPQPLGAGDWRCEHCGRPGAEILAAHRLDAIRIAVRGIGDCNEVSRTDVRPYLRKFAKRLRVPFLALLECVDPDVLASDVSGLPTTRCTAAVNTDCANETADSAAAVGSVRAQAGIEAVAVFLDEVEEGYEYDALSTYCELAEKMQLPRLVFEVLIARVVGNSIDLSAIDAFNAWRAAEPLAAQMLEDA